MCRFWRGHLKGPAVDLESLAFDQRHGNLAMGLGEDALKGGARDSHTFGCLFLSQALQVGQTECLQLLLKKLDSAQSIQGHPSRLVDSRLGCPVQETPFAWSGHVTLALGGLSAAATAVTASSFGLLPTLFAAGQVDDLGIHGLCQCFQFLAADAGMKHF